MKRADHQIVQQVLDGTVSKDSFDDFQQRLRDEPELVRLYGDYAHLHHSLYEEFEDQAITKSPVLTSSRTRGAGFIWIAVAAAVALVAAMIYRTPRVQAPPAPLLAKVEFSPDAVWQVEGVSRTGSNTVELGEGSTLKLEQGQAAVLSGRAVSALVDGPSVLTLVSDKALHLASGKVRFKVMEAGAGMEVTTPSMSALDMGTEFAIEVRAEHPDELHVFDGKVAMRINGSMDKEVLNGGEAGRVVGKDQIEKFPAVEQQFLKEPRSFKSLVEGRFEKKNWRLDYGLPMISEDGIEGRNYSVFLPLTQLQPMADDAVLMATLKVNRPANGEFHTAGWAGLSFFSERKEVLFFGDSFGPETTWSLDVKQRIPVILPVTPLVGPRTVTLRYDRGTGAVSLHDGGIPLGKSFCSGRIPAGLMFDEIRLGASSGAALDVASLTIRVSE